MLTRGHRLHSVLMHAGLAAALAQSGQIDEAIVHYRRLLELAHE